MQTTTLGPFTVSRLCLGTMLMGGVIDLYQIHAPDPDVPIEETLEALDGLVRADMAPIENINVDLGALIP